MKGKEKNVGDFVPTLDTMHLVSNSMTMLLYVNFYKKTIKR